MRFLYHIILIVVLTITHQIVCAQNNKIDSLLELTNTTIIEDTVLNFNLIALAKEYRYIGEFDKSLDISKKALKLGYELSLKSTNYSNEINIATVYNNLGIIYWNQGKYDESLKNHYTALKIREQTLAKAENKNNTYIIQLAKEGIASSFNNIGLVYANQNNMEKALENYFNATKIYETFIDKKGQANTYNNIGIIYYNHNNFDQSLLFYSKSLEIYKELNDKQDLAASLGNIGIIYRNKGNFNNALENYLASLKLREEIQDKIGIADLYVNLANLYFEKKEFIKAKDYVAKSISISEELGLNENLMQCYEVLTLCDVALGNWKDAYLHHKLYKEHNDSIFNAESTGKIIEMMTRFESEKKESQIKL